MNARVSLARVGALMALLALGSCGGGGGGGDAPPSCDSPGSDFVGVCAGFTGNLDWAAGGDGSGGVGDGGASGDGGVGAGGDFGQFRGATVKVYKEDGTLLGTAVTDSTTGMVTIRPGRSYRGALRVELSGGPNATYYEEGREAFVPFPADRTINVIVPRIDKNIGATAFSEAAYRLLKDGSTAQRAAGANPTPAEIAAANARVKDLLNQHFPGTLQIDDVTRLPFIKAPGVLAGAISAANQRGRYGLVNGAFSKQAAMYNSGSAAPTLDALAQLSTDLLDGQLDGRNGNAPAAAADKRTYDPHTLTGELSSAVAHQAKRFGSADAFDALPKVLNFGNTRYTGYLFDGTVTRDRRAFSTVAGWVGGNSLGFTLGQPLQKSAGGDDVYNIYANFGHGGAFFKSDPVNDPSRGRLFALGDNVNGELGLGNTTSTDRALIEITLPASLTHIAGGFAHTVARLANGDVYAWGDNSFGQLGQGVDGSVLPRSTTPVRVPLPAGVVAVAATSVASYALMADGTVYTWGSNGGFGLLGNGQRDSMLTTPALVSGLNDVVQVSARDNDVVVQRRDNTLWQWGSFPAPDNAFTPGDPGAPYAGGNLAPTQLPGLDAALVGGVTIRKVLTEQSLVVALLSNGHVYNWGVYFDLTAQGIQKDLQATRVLGLPPLRDIMPGGFNGYGVRPFDRNTAMGIDYRGGMWKIRGRVAEQFDPDHPAQQRRPQNQSPRPDCANCHLFLADWPLTPDAPTTTAICQPTSVTHGSSTSSLIHAETQCEQCHNPARNPPIAAFPNGWLACVRPNDLPPRPALIPPTPASTSCVVPVGHVFTPPGTVCATCHNSVVARPFSQLSPPCAQPLSTELPTVPTVARISAVINDSGATVPAGAFTSDTTPELRGTLSVALRGTQTLAVSRNGTVIGNAVASSTTWSFVDSAAPQGLVTYSARVIEGTGFGATSNAYAIQVDSIAPTAVPAVTGIFDDLAGQLGSSGWGTDTTPTVSGTFSAAPAAGEIVQVLRNGQVAGSATVSGGTWTFTEPAALALGSYTYAGRLQDPALNNGPSGATLSVTLVAGLAAATITQAVDVATGTVIAAGSQTRVTTPTLQGLLSAALPAGQTVPVLRNGALVGNATVSGQNWSFTDNAPQGLVSYQVNVIAGVLVGTASPALAFTVDSIAPTQVANVTGIADDFSGALAAGATTPDQTPTVSGTLSAGLGSGEQLRLLRALGAGAAQEVARLSPAGLTWNYTEPSLLAAGTYTYQAQVIDGVALTSALGSSRTVTIDPTAVPLPGFTIALATVNSVTPVGGSVPISNVTTPALAGTVTPAPGTGQVLRVYRNGVGVANATVVGNNWSFTNGALADGAYAFFARVEVSGNSNVFSQPSATVNATLDATAPVQVATISGIFDAASVSVGGGNTSTTTPRISGTLNAVLGTAETLRLERTGPTGGPVVLAPTVSGGTNWTLTEAAALAVGNYSYTAVVQDTAGNRGPLRTQTVNIIAPLTTAAVGSVSYSAGLAAPRADGTVVASGGFIADLTPTVNGTIGAGLPNAQTVVRVYRGGVAVGTATVTTTTWTFVDADVGQGARSYTARVENGSAYGSSSAAYAVTVDTVVPTQTFAAITASSSVAPNTAVANATPPNGIITSGGSTNDPAPSLRIPLLAALGSGESLRIRRNGVIVSAVTTTACPGIANCFDVEVPAPITLPVPPTAPQAAVPSAAQGYTITVVDLAGNENTATPAFNIVYNYFACDFVRADATRRALQGIAHPNWTLTVTNCSGCHAGTTSAVNPTPAGAMVPVPTTTPTYWCRR